MVGTTFILIPDTFVILLPFVYNRLCTLLSNLSNEWFITTVSALIREILILRLHEITSFILCPKWKYCVNIHNRRNENSFTELSLVINGHKKSDLLISDSLTTFYYWNLSLLELVLFPSTEQCSQRASFFCLTNSDKRSVDI